MGFLLGSIITLFLFSGVSISHEALKSIEETQGKLAKWLQVKSCETAIVKDLDILDGKVLVKAKGVYFIMTARDSKTFEICPIGVSVGKNPTLDNR